MRIVLASDGSGPADMAVDFVAAVRWPDETIVRVVVADESAPDLSVLPWLGEPILERTAGSFARTREVWGIHDRIAPRLSAAGLGVEPVVPRDRAAAAIVREACDWGADLIVLGSRGHSLVERLLLGSVSAEVMDRAPCPVLIARRPAVHRIVVGVDGSPTSAIVLDLLRRPGVFAEIPLIAASVITDAESFVAGPDAALAGFASERAEAVAEAHRRHAEMALVAVAALRTGRPQAATLVLSGDPAQALMAAAAHHEADLIAVGSHGRTGLTRQLLGSVARDLVLHATCSVLVAPSHPAGRRAVATDSDREPIAAGRD